MKAASWALVVGLVLVATVAGRGSGAGWKQVATSTPLTTRDFFGAAAYDVDATAGVLIFGGDTYTGSSTVSLGDCWAGDVGSNAWNKDPYDLPPARAYTTLGTPLPCFRCPVEIGVVGHAIVGMKLVSICM